MKFLQIAKSCHWWHACLKRRWPGGKHRRHHLGLTSLHSCNKLDLLCAILWAGGSFDGDLVSTLHVRNGETPTWLHFGSNPLSLHRSETGQSTLYCPFVCSWFRPEMAWAMLIRTCHPEDIHHGRKQLRMVLVNQRLRCTFSTYSARNILIMRLGILQSLLNYIHGQHC